MATVNVKIPTPLRKLTAGESTVKGQGATMRALIDELEGRFPGLKARICDPSGKVLRFVNVFQNGEDIRFLADLDTPLADGDEVRIVPAIAGG